MKLIATYDFLWGPDADREIIRRGDEFEPPGTCIMNRDEHARILIRQGAAVTPDAWAKRKPTPAASDAIWQAAQVLVDEFRAGRAA